MQVPATRVAPQHDGGDEDRPAVWVPVCDMHFEDWYEDVDDPLPAFALVVNRMYQVEAIFRVKAEDDEQAYAKIDQALDKAFHGIEGCEAAGFESWEMLEGCVGEVG